MSDRNWWTAAFLVVIPLLLAFPAKPVIRQVDHILVESTDPRSLYDVFTDTLQLPVAWPFVDGPAFSSGGFGAGNVSIELFRPGAAESAKRSPRARYSGLAFEPYGSLPDCLPEMKSRGIAHDSPQPFTSILPNKTRGIMWTTVLLTGLTTPELSVLLYQYSSAFLNVHVHRNQLAGQLVLRKGGPLGIVSVKEIVLSSAEPAQDAARWQRLFAPVEPSAPRLWEAGNGPAIRLVPGSGGNRILRLLLSVQSLDRARTFLEARRMLGAVLKDQIEIDPSRVQGLRLRLMEESDGGPAHAR